MAQINKPSDYFNTKLYTGNATDNTAITGVGFQPDFTWIKARSINYSHNAQDAVRGAGQRLEPDQTSAEGTYTSFKSFDTDGFTLGTGAGVNDNGQTFASWNWLGANGTAANTDGSISSTVSTNTTSGFSIVSYTGTGSAATIGHGLGVAPKMIIQKNRDEAQPWWVWHSSLTGANSYLRLNGTNAEGTDGAALWNSTLPTSSVFSVGDNTGINGSADKCIAYCFAEKQGYSKFGSYTGNGNSDGTFVYTGFKPAFVIIKKTSGTSNWTIWDTARQSNEINKPLWADLNNAEAAQSTVKLDLLSNGFKIRGNGSNVGSSGGTYIYMAFAENPLVGTNNIPATAR